MVSRKHFDFLRRLVLGGAALALLGTSGCTNNLSLTTNLANSTVSASNPNGGTVSGTSGNAGSFTLSRVVKDNVNPSTTLDLVGDGSGAFGSLCISTATGASSSTSPTVCNCVFSYNTSSHPNTQQINPVTYHENDMVRCLYSNIPTDVKTMQVQLQVSSSDSYSNTVNFTFSGNGVTLDTSSSSSFIMPIRYQCRDLVFIPYIYDGNMYDPIQSEDFHITYPLDFYATNLGYAVSTYVAQGNVNPANQAYWNCPQILNPVRDLAGTLTNAGTNLGAYVAQNHINLKVYSKAPLSGSKLIYPPTPGIFDRSTFYLAKQSSGVFSIPLDALMAPGVNTSTSDPSSPGSTIPPLGYGAAPIPNPTVPGQETCPDTSVPIPAGYQWVKVWLFRASLPQRHYAKSGQSPTITDVQNIICNPGDWANTAGSPPSNYSPIFPSCQLSHSNAGSSYALSDLNDTHYLASRVLTLSNGTSICADLDNSTLASSPNYCAAATATTVNPGAGCDATTGADYWLPESTYASATSPTGCGPNAPSPLIDPFHVCSLTSNSTPAPPTPYSTSVGIGDLDTGTPRYDFLFVVTPPTISVSDMQDTSPSSASLPYQPYRFFTDQDCLSPDPDNPVIKTPPDCSPANAINTYGLKLHSVGSNGDPPASDPNRAGVFPICALQPI